MVHFTDKRYRLNGEEVGPVMGLVNSRLLELIEIEANLGEAELLFRVLYRFKTYRVGRPTYPDPLTWEVIRDWVEENGPIQFKPLSVSASIGENKTSNEDD
jgi:hypothetical protein